MNRFVKFAQNGIVCGAGVLTHDTDYSGKLIRVHYHNGIKITSADIEKWILTEITPQEFERTVRKKGQTSMLQYLNTTETETIEWHTDPKDLPTIGKYCLVFTNSGLGLGPECHATFTGENWRMHDGYRHKKDFIKAWAYEPKGPKN